MILGLPDRTPLVDPSAWLAPSATVVGDVVVGAQASIWYLTVVRGDAEAIRIGPGSNLQDGCVLHADPGFPLEVGAEVVVGHRAVLHGCRVEDGCLIGIGAVVMNGAVIGEGSLVGAGALVTEGTVVPPRSLVLGSPGRVKRSTTDAEVAGIRANAAHYRALRLIHGQARVL